MNDIDKIYSNKIGISFFWKQEKEKTERKVQVVFKEIGFLLTVNELKDFSEFCIHTIKSQCCNLCPRMQHCKSLLLRTPSDKIDLAVSKNELFQIHELLNATIFKVELATWVKNISLN
ncbi:hypothetical protein ABW636_03115 [Aquimarina sp. 2201CG1-2-11]|uniref:hypothetical protein n=1 Tax=Aquimarina discodermiae TaxID=3231043 RepID=UPI003463799C